ncbi:helix-turn-helix domain-containing protein [Enterococcus faecium]|uniref:Helix-turn-helix domain-containing protein n=11 Tax=Enterococcus TaxID=1350 RepID=A0ABD7LSK6_ENTFC|nr:transcriptional regulator [Enterococcus faecium EnGen0008]ELB13139.1 transcriptional regulator [Enterococcus faecium EnGen0032]SAY62211.1 helix-turn-helix domain-containing protein [Enterococcus faecium]SAZ15471.1 helix-turn-helix domain-containing protein [Enterococcus faecium]SAZ19559.1 helix-turn-helix domain-containing protein [Enterococcus faecium]
MNVTQQCVSSWQTGRTIPKPYQMKMLSEILSVPMNELFSDVFNKVNS